MTPPTPVAAVPPHPEPVGTQFRIPHAAQAIIRRWPALLGVLLGLLSIDGLQDGVPLAAALAMGALGYLLVALIGRPGLTWPLVLGLAATVVAVRALGGSPIPLFANAAAALALAAVLSGRLRTSLLRLLQAPAALLFGAVALAATLVPTERGSVLVAVGLIAHAGWDAVLWYSHRLVVARSFVEWCAAFDLVAGIGILAFVVT